LATAILLSFNRTNPGLLLQYLQHPGGSREIHYFYPADSELCLGADFAPAGGAGRQAGIMDFDQLHTFLEIVRLKSFSKAAQTCYRTQPAISAQVRQLEQELKTALFERFGSRISLTTAGKIFAGYAEQILDLRRRAQDAINELDRNPRGELVIAANEATCIYVLPQVFSEYRKMFPAVQLQVDRSYGSRVVEAVLENTADFGLTQLPVQEKRLQVVNIHQDEIRLMVPSGHALAGRSSVEARDLLEFPMILPKSGTTRTRLNTWLELVEEELHVSMELDSTEMMKQFTMAGLGLTFLAMSNCREEIADGKLHAVPLAPEPMVRRLGLIYRKDKALSKAALGFISVVLDKVGERRAPIEASKKPQAVAG
jgi:DNA-binding transcriptional LysR family regulator